MRIIGGKLKGLKIQAPKNLPVRPTTDLAKEALFNILQNQYDLENLDILDLFSGTGNISLEFASRGAKDITSVDLNFGCYQFLKDIAKQKNLPNIKSVKSDVFKFLSQTKQQFDIIFADPPYQLNKIPEIPVLVFKHQLLNSKGLLIVEHQSMQNLSDHPNFSEVRKYGNSSFSFFEN